MIIFGWMRRFTILGVKLEECLSCGQVCEHVVGRKTNWAHVFWIPVLFLGWEHGMVCTTCHTWTGIPWQQVREAMKTGLLHLERPRPSAPAITQAVAEDGQPPVPVAAVFDPMLINPRRGLFDMYLKAWPIAVACLLLFGAVSSAVKPSATYGGTSTYGSGTSTYGSGSSTYGSGSVPAVRATPRLPAHQCWSTTDGSIGGCRLSTGAVVGSSTGTPVTCYFADSDLATSDTLNCDR